MAQERSSMAMEKQRLDFKKQCIDKELMPPPQSIPLPIQHKIKNRTNYDSDNEPYQSTAPTQEKKFQKDAESLDDVFELFISKIEGIQQGRQNLDKDIEKVIYNEIPKSSPWKEVLEPNTNKIYYWNTQTGEVSWEPPKDTADFKSSCIEDLPDSTSITLNNSMTKLSEVLQSDTKHESSMEAKLDASIDSQDIINPKLFPTSTIKNNDKKIEQFAYQLKLLQALFHSESNSFLELTNFEDMMNLKENQYKSNSNTQVNKMQDDSISLKLSKQSELTLNENSYLDTDHTSPLTRESPPNVRILAENSSQLTNNIQQNISESNESTPPSNLRNKNIQMEETFQDLPEIHTTEKADPFLNKIFQLLNTINKTILHNTSIIDNNYKLELKAQIDTRMSDWSAGELSSEYFIAKLNETIKNFEDLVDSIERTSDTRTINNQLDCSVSYESMAFDPNSSLNYDPNSNNLSLGNIYGFPMGSFPMTYVPTMIYDYHNAPIINTLNDLTIPTYNQMYETSTNISNLAHFSSNYTELYDNTKSLSSSTSISKDNQMIPNYGHIAKDTVAPSTSISSGQAPEVPTKKKKKLSATSLSQRKKLELTDNWKKSAELAKLEDEVELDEFEDSNDGLQKQEEILIEKWKESQISSGAAAKNVNFIPIVKDWRTSIQKHEDNL